MKELTLQSEKNRRRRLIEVVYEAKAGHIGGCYDLGILRMERIQRCSQGYHTYDCNYVYDVCCGASPDHLF